jgi:hypothetical protein
MRLDENFAGVANAPGHHRRFGPAPFPPAGAHAESLGKAISCQFSASHIERTQEKKKEQSLS